MVGTLYKEGDARRDRGFSIFYMGINIGGLASPIVAGFLAKYWGFHWGFGSAGVGMIFSLLIFVLGRRYLAVHPEKKDTIPTKLPKYGWLLVPAISAAGLGVIHLLGTYAKVTFQQIVQVARVGLVPILALSILAMLVYIISKTGDKIARHRLFALMAVFMGVLVQCIVFEQAGGSFNLYAKKYIARTFLGYEIPAAFFQCLNPLFVVLFSLPVSFFWSWFNKKFGGQSIMIQFGLGIILLAGSCLVLVFCEMGRLVTGTQLASPLWFVAIYWIQTISELCITPVALSFVTKAAPSRFSTMMMGIMWGVISLGYYFAGEIGALADPIKYGITSTFSILFVATLVVGCLFLLASKKIVSWCHGIEKEIG